MTTAAYSEPWLLWIVAACAGIGSLVLRSQAERSPVENGAQFTGLRINILNVADVAVVDLLVVVILDLHRLVTGSKCPAESLHLALACWIQGCLKLDVEGAGTNAASVHRAKHLNVAERIKTEAPWD